MVYLQPVLALLVFAQHLAFTRAVPLEERAGDVCGSGIYGELVPYLKPYPVAQAFCSAVYPVKCSSVNKAKRQLSTTSKISTTPTAPSTIPKISTTSSKSSSKTTTSSIDPKASAWSKCQKQGGNVVSTICSCIQSQKVSAYKDGPHSLTNDRNSSLH